LSHRTLQISQLLKLAEILLIPALVPILAQNLFLPKNTNFLKKHFLQEMAYKVFNICFMQKTHLMHFRVLGKKIEGGQLFKQD
jgi:hypothetical protein